MKTAVDEKMQELASVILDNAKTMLVEKGSLPPCVLLLTADGGIHVMGIEIDKDLVGKREAYAEVSRKARELSALAGFLVNDAWVKAVTAKPSETPESIAARQSGPIRDDPERKSAILVVGMGPIFRNFILAATYAREGDEVHFSEESIAENMHIGVMTPWWD